MAQWYTRAKTVCEIWAQFRPHPLVPCVAVIHYFISVCQTLHSVQVSISFINSNPPQDCLRDLYSTLTDTEGFSDLPAQRVRHRESELTYAHFPAVLLRCQTASRRISRPRCTAAFQQRALTRALLSPSPPARFALRAQGARGSTVSTRSRPSARGPPGSRPRARWRRAARAAWAAGRGEAAGRSTRRRPQG